MSRTQLQAKFKHAGDFGVAGNYSKVGSARFSSAINQHLNKEGVSVIQGSYRGNPVVHYLESRTGLNVMSDRAGNFVSGWKLSPGQSQNVMSRGSL
ncbi:MAG: hypothetical protein EOP04_09715 [Proteobacteria bacterium]|nr:MAG: hypothetical protein EOP04_09715 [Pseudomonadota bacterium]